ncbi:MAG: heavy metal-binding domain-containing protein [Clostridia bacterium]|nr:heavy metal-binding domain-containing protein [Clostridia bacterium]
MKLRDIASTYNVDKRKFESFILTSGFPHTVGFSGIIIEDHMVQNALNAFQEDLQNKKAEINRQQEEEMKKRKAMSEMLITSGFTFDGYKITKYSGYISGDDAVSVERGMAIFGTGPDVKDKLMSSLVKIRRNALAELKEAAYALGCNAVIGVDFDYLTLDPQTANFGGGTTYQPYIFGVTANGNAVVIEKIEE